MDKYAITYQVGELEYKTIIVSGNSYGQAERKFIRTIGYKNITKMEIK